MKIRKLKDILTKSVVTIITLLITGCIWSQTYFNMSSGNYSQTFTNISATWPTNFNAVSVGGTATIPDATKTTVTSTTPATVGTGSAIGQDATTSTKLIFLPTGATDNTTSLACDLNLNFSGRAAGTLSFDVATVNNGNSTNTRKSTLRVYYSIDGTTWTEITGTNLPFIATNNTASSVTVSVTLPSAINSQSNVKLRFYTHNGPTGGSGNRPKVSVDNISVTSNVDTSPSITTSVSSLTVFSACSNVQSSEQSFTVSGSNLSGNIIVTAPTGFQITTTSGSGYSSSVTLTQSSGSVSTTTIYAIMSAQSSNPTAANITCTSTSATTKNISVSGSVLTTPSITTNPSNASVSSGGNTSFTTVGSNIPTSYTWQVSTDGGTNWSTISNGGVYTNSTTATLSITGATFGMNGYKYKVSATNACGTSSYSTIATLTVTYCTPTYSNGGSTDYITQVTLVGNSTTLSQSTASNTSPYYINYTSTQNTIPELTKGSTYNLSLSFGSNSSQYNGVWIDLNQDGTLSTSEFFTSNSNAGASGTVTVSLAIPSGATTGQCLMRIRGGEDSQLTSSQACGASSSSWGQAQDYYVTISVPVPPTITSLGSTSGCVGSSITINGTNLSGVTASNVTIGGTAVSSITTNTSSQIVAVIGSGTTGVVSVTTGGGTVTYGTFTVNSSPTISYTGSPFSYPQNSTISNLTPTTNASSFSVSPALPSGLGLSSSTGVISGTPTTLQSATSYTITATGSNSCTNTTSISISVTIANGTCSNSTTLNCGDNISASTVGTTGLAHGIPTSSTYNSLGVSNYGVWYKIVGDGNVYTITVTPESTYDIEVDVMSGSCGTYTAVTSADFGASGGVETVSFTSTSGVNYYIYIAHYLSGSTSTNTFSISVTGKPSRPSIISGTNTVCSTSTNTYSVTNVSGLTYNWTLPSGWSGSSSSNSISVTSGSTSGTLKVTSTNSCGTSNPSSISVTGISPPTSVSAGTDNSVCLGNGVSLNATSSVSTVQLYNFDCSSGYNWTTTSDSRWYVTSTNYAGGSTGEFDFYYSVGASGVSSSALYSNIIQGSGYTSLSMSFRHSVDWVTGNAGSVMVETSPDGTTWTSRWTQAVNGADISYPGGVAVNVDLSSLNSTNFYFRFRFSGNTNRINDWYIDDIVISGTPTVSYSWINTTTGLSATNVNNPTASPSITTTYTVQASVGGCVSTSDDVLITVNQPSVTSINGTTGQTLNNGDYVWDGSSTTSWGTSGNWYVYNGSSFDIATSDPTSTSNVIIVPTSTTQCISSTNSPILSLTDQVKDLIVVSGSTLDLSNNIISVSGNVKIDGTISGTGTINLNGTGTQTISGTGTITLPNLSINKSSGSVTLSSPLKVSNALTMNSVNINNGSNLLEVGTSSSNLGSITWTSGSITGPLKRWFGNTTNTTLASGIFPVGNSTYNRYAQISFTSAPSSGGSITTQYVSGLPSLVYNGLPLTASDGQLVQNYEDEGYWDITPDSYTGSLSQATYNIELRGNNLSNPTDISVARIIKSEGPSHTTWSACGTHGSASGTISDFTINSTSNTGFSFFNIGSTNNSPLPIELLSFTANCSDDGTLITWKTASESNTSHFNLEKSRNGIDWEIIHTEQAAGNSNQLITYNFTDKSSLNGLIYYRLNQYDLNGVYEQFGPISINCLKTSDGYFSVFPNPSSTEFSVIVNNELLIGDATLLITNDMGKEIYTKNIKVLPGINLLNIEKLNVSSGIYYISIVNTYYTTGVLKHVIR